MPEAKTFLLEIVTPQGVVFSDQVEAVRAPGIDGYFGVLPGHTPLMTALRVGEIRVRRKGELIRFATSGGFVEVLPRRMIILAETAEEAAKIDVARALAARERALKRLRQRTPDIDLERARAALARAMNRLRVAGYEEGTWP
ncbi:MAG: F0F1 ATP synthase subunit epsilon [candidate division KSB1 bacterium]|nr:F0F1 ATP synthase subunit epsilon [candidate division KSB1 bacterium]